MHDYELDSKGPVVSTDEAVRARRHQDERDAYYLERMGKRQVLKRNFGFMQMIGFSCTILVTWEAVLLTFQIGYNNGGPAGAVYGFLLVWLGTACTYLSLSEMASMAPTSGGQYQ